MLSAAVCLETAAPALPPPPPAPSAPKTPLSLAPSQQAVPRSPSPARRVPFFPDRVLLPRELPLLSLIQTPPSLSSQPQQRSIISLLLLRWPIPGKPIPWEPP